MSLSLAEMVRAMGWEIMAQKDDIGPCGPSMLCIRRPERPTALVTLRRRGDGYSIECEAKGVWQGRLLHVCDPNKEHIFDAFLYFRRISNIVVGAEK